MLTARVPINELKLVAWHELLANQSIMSYQIEYEYGHDLENDVPAIAERIRYYDRFGNHQPFLGVVKLFREASKQFLSMAPAFERLGRAFGDILSSYSDKDWASPLDSTTEGRSGGERDSQ